MENLNLLLGLHSHQPVGNFEYIFEDSYKKCYLPFIEIAKQYPSFKFTVHYTGPLMQFFELKHPEYIEELNKLSEKGQIEFVISGFYEPVLASLPERDRIHQIAKSVNYVKQTFGIRPQGLWLTERVFEGDVLKTLVSSGIKYVVIDDYHFLQAGIGKDSLYGYYVTEFEGKKINVFPINQKLRYLIPFKPVPEIMKYLSELLRKTTGDAAIIFDDGEKFGVWPGTNKWVYKDGWLGDFIKAITADNHIKTDTYMHYIKTHKPLGRVYFPSSSYFEMGEWSLFPEAGVKFSEFIQELKEKGQFERYKMFVKGGIWKNFLVKYEESNNMHKKMLFVSQKVNQSTRKGRKKARDYLMKAQCNDAYWHGVFGGLYLPHLRRAVYSNLLKAENMAYYNASVKGDINCDGYDEIYLRNSVYTTAFSTKNGGSMYELSFNKKAVNMQDTLTRRFEHYHKGLQIESSKDKSGITSIHEMQKTITEEAHKELIYDWYPRYSFITHILPMDINLNDYRYNKYRELGDFVNQPFESRLEKKKKTLLLRRTGGIFVGDKRIPAEIRKYIRVRESGILADINIKKDAGTFLMGTEFNLMFVKPNFMVDNETVNSSKDREFFAKGSELLIYDDFYKLNVILKSNEILDIWGFPIYTVSQSESGMDMVYQGTAITFLKALKKTITNFNITIKIMEKNYA